MKITEFITEAKKQQPIKARDPNWRDMEALRKSGAAGSHGDKTKIIPRKEKYKKIDELIGTNSLDREDKIVLARLTKQYKEHEKLVANAPRGSDDKMMYKDRLRDLAQMIKYVQGKTPRGIDTALEEEVYEMYEKVRAELKLKGVKEADPDTLGNMNDKMRDVLSKVDADDKAKVQAAKDKAEAERQAKMKELGPDAMDKYIDMLKKHDWSYQYSDDHRYYVKGSEEDRAIRNLQKIIDPNFKVYNKYAPEGFKIKVNEEKQKGVDGKACWKGYKRMGTKMKGGKRVDNCVPIKKKTSESATAGATSSGSIATVVSPHIAIGNKKARDAYGKKGMPARPPKAKMQKPTDNALDMKGTSVFGGTLKR